MFRQVDWRQLWKPICETPGVKAEHVKMVGPDVAPASRFPHVSVRQTRRTQYQILWSKNNDFGFKMVALTFSWVHDCIVKQCGHTPCCPWNKQTSEMTAHHREYARIIKRHWSRRGVGLRRKEHFHLQHKNRFDQVTASTGVFLKAARNNLSSEQNWCQFSKL